MGTFAYIGDCQLHDGSRVQLDFEERGWADKEMLSQVKRWSLVPNSNQLTLDGRPYPLVTIEIPEGAKPVFRTRVYNGVITKRSSDQIERKVRPLLVVPSFRSYCIGWKQGSTFSWTWVHPNGAIENTCGDDSYLGDVLRAHLNTIVIEVPEEEPTPEAALTPQG